MSIVLVALKREFSDNCDLVFQDACTELQRRANRANQLVLIFSGRC